MAQKEPGAIQASETQTYMAVKYQSKTAMTSIIIVTVKTTVMAVFSLILAMGVS